MKTELEQEMRQSASMGAFDSLKLKLNNFVIDKTIDYLGNNFSRNKLIGLAEIFEKISGSKGGIKHARCDDNGSDDGFHKVSLSK